MTIATILAALEAGAQEPERLRAEVAQMRPERLAWREIDWKTCPLGALAESREKKRPVLAWVFLGNPSMERC